ncbi:polysaccharide deacetylase family protein [Nitrosomonas marina]|nr:polysaccharide deacetylase family protein [Nitrosomonas marina]
MRVTVLMYHMIDTPVTPEERRFCRSPENFRNDMQIIHEAGYRVISMKTLLEAIKNKDQHLSKAVVITFDDGLACNYENALPVLEEFGYTASVFVVTSYIGGYNDFSRNYGFSRRRMLTVNQIKALKKAGVDIGSHTVHHLALGKTATQVTIDEILKSKCMLEDILACEVPHFAYPFGSWNPAVREIVMNANYTGACSTMPWPNRLDTDPFLLRRSEIKGQDNSAQFRLKLRFATNTMPPVAEARQLARGFLEKMKVIPPKRFY